MVQEIIEVVCRTIQANRSTTDAIGGNDGLLLSMRGGALLLKGAAIASFTLLALSPNASARMRCSYSGAPQNLLTVTADRAALGEIFRSRQRIVVREFLERPRRCQGGVPTVRNTDAIRVLLRGARSSVDVLLAGGPFEPGATREWAGRSEIEIEFRGGGGFGNIIGTSRPNTFQWGAGYGIHAGLNLNPRGGRDRDVDVTLRGRGDAFLAVEGGAGNDTIVPAPGAPFPNDGSLSEGGPGDDRLVALRNSRADLTGGAGDDVLIGGDRRGDDLDAGYGDDRIDSRDSKPDIVRCGPGHDRVKADRRDQLEGFDECEVVRRR